MLNSDQLKPTEQKQHNFVLRNYKQTEKQLC